VKSPEDGQAVVEGRCGWCGADLERGEHCGWCRSCNQGWAVVTHRHGDGRCATIEDVCVYGEGLLLTRFTPYAPEAREFVPKPRPPKAPDEWEYTSMTLGVGA
jgi:hypothetical protein